MLTPRYVCFIQITDIDEPPDSITFDYNPVRESLSNVTIGILTARDPEGKPLTFKVNDTTNTFSVSYMTCKHAVKNHLYAGRTDYIR